MAPSTKGVEFRLCYCFVFLFCVVVLFRCAVFVCLFVSAVHHSCLCVCVFFVLLLFFIVFWAVACA